MTDTTTVEGNPAYTTDALTDWFHTYNQVTSTMPRKIGWHRDFAETFGDYIDRNPNFLDFDTLTNWFHRYERRYSAEPRDIVWAKTMAEVFLDDHRA